MDLVRRIQEALNRQPSGSTGGAMLPVRPKVLQGHRSSSFPLIIFLLSLLSLLVLPAPSRSATPPGTDIVNTASAVYTSTASTAPLLATSNTVTVTTVALRTPSTIELLQHAPASPLAVPTLIMPTEASTTTSTSGPFVSLPTPTTVGGAPIPVPPGGTLLPLVPASQYHVGEPVFIRVTDLDQNLDPLARETVLVTIGIAAAGELEILRLTETGPDAGVFTGFIQSGPGPVVIVNGILNVQAEDRIAATYTDAVDNTDSTSSSVLVDPYGIVFSSGSGQPVDGVTVALINAATNLPATVYGDDGISIFPSTLVTGGTATDSSGRVYSFPAGGYRFPFIPPGQYRFAVTPPAAYRAPSLVPDAVLQALPGGPFALVTPGSRGETFTVNAGPAVHIDIPVDPVASRLYLRKRALKDTAGIGDFVPYQLFLENTDTVAAIAGITVTDRLPLGFRYRPGSARMDGGPIADPAVSEDGRTLTFALGTLPAGATRTFSYVTAIGAGSRTGTAENSAVATAPPDIVSNTATATVTVIEDLYRSVATIVGRVAVDGCGDPELAQSSGLEGARVFLETGANVVTDRNGMFHFAAVQPGTHVVQLDLAGLQENYEVLLCEENTRFAGNGFSQFVDIQGGALWRADFHLALKPRPLGTVSIELQTPVKTGEAEPTEESIRARKDIIKYTVPIHVSAVPARNLRITVMLPDGGVYRAGSSTLDDASIADPQVVAGAVTFRLAEAPANWDGMLKFDALVPVSGALGPLQTQAILTADTPQDTGARTPVVNTVLVRVEKDYEVTAPDIVLHPQFESGSASLSRKDMQDLDTLVEQLQGKNIARIKVTGHTDSRPLSERLKKLYADNYILSQARASSVGHYLARKLSLDPAKITFEGKGPDEAVASNSTENGRARNRRVELRITTMRTVMLTDIQTQIASSGEKSIATVGLRPGEAWKQETPAEAPVAKKPVDTFDAAWLADAEPGSTWLWPPHQHHPAIPITKAAVKHAPDAAVALRLNGEPVDAITFDGTLKRHDNAVAVSSWSGIHLREGDNSLEVVVTGPAGSELLRETRVVHYSGTPVAAVYVPERSRPLADGKTPPVIAVRFTDKDGHPAREGLLGEFAVDPPYLPNQRVVDLQRVPLVAAATDRVRYQVGEDGIALIELAPTPRSGEAVVRIPLASGQQEIRTWLKPEVRDWILVGLAEGTAGYNTATGNMETLAGSGIEDTYYQDGRVAFYAKGRIKGEWLLTMAYDSAEKNNGQKSMYQTIDPDKYYLLYGDATQEQYDAPSSRHIYVKLERDQFYALFGDYDTGLTVTELSRYSRNFTGFKSELRSDRGDLTVFASDTNQAFVKDEIPGDGTSGLYHLSRKKIVLNSETIVIETRDRFRSEVIVSTQRLTRHLDYTIDYETGTLFFKFPVYSRDGNFNPVYIVATYESFDSVDRSTTYGGRGALRFLDKRVEVGGTYIREGRTGGSAELSGADATVRIDEHTKVRVEAAETTNTELGTTTEGSAYLAEVTHNSPKLDGRVYVREQDEGFGLGQQNGSETGTRKTGFDLVYRMTDSFSLKSLAFRQETFSTGAVRDMAEIEGRVTGSRYEYFLGLRHAEDTFSTGDVRASEQVYTGVRFRATDRLTLRVQHDETVADRGGNSADYPTRTTVGADYQLTKDTAVFADQELTKGEDKDTATTRFGFRSSPWSGGQVSSTVEEQSTENGSRLFSTMGLKQSWQVTKQWTLDAGLDRSATFHQTGSFQPDPTAPPASGGEDFTAVNFGAGYKAEKWSWTGRVESRHADTYDKWGLYSGANGEPAEGTGLAAVFQGFWTGYETGSRQSDRQLRLGLAYRPRETRWIVLDRLDGVVAENRDSTIAYNNWRVVNNLVLNYKVQGTGQLSFQYGAKYVEESIDATDYRGYTDLVGLEARYDITRKVDLGLRGSMLTTWDTGQTAYGTAVSVGFTMAKNFWLSVGYNLRGFQDRDFSKAEFTAEGPFIKLRMKFDQVSAREAIKWFTGQ